MTSTAETDGRTSETDRPAAGTGSPIGDADGPAGASERTVDEVERLLDAVDAALVRLDVGTYATCSACGGPISDSYHGADPTATTCGRCEVPPTDQSTSHPVD